MSASTNTTVSYPPSHPFSIPVSRTALLVCDMQNAMLAANTTSASLHQLLSTTATLISTARSLSIPVIYIVLQFSESHPEISMSNKIFSGVKTANRLVTGTPSTEIANEVTPIGSAGDIIITKHRLSAFHDTKLSEILSSLNIKSIVVAGVKTSGTILSTVRSGGDLDYVFTVVKDAVTDGDEEVGTMLIEKVLPMQATLMTSAEWIAGVKQLQVQEMLQTNE